MEKSIFYILSSVFYTSLLLRLNDWFVKNFVDISALFSIQIDQVMSFVVSVIIFQIILMGGMFFTFVHISDTTIPFEIDLSESTFNTIIYSTILLFIFGFATNVISSMIGDVTANPHPMILLIDEFILYAIAFFGIVVIVAVFEELYFRGFIQTFLRGHTSAGVSIFVTSCLFMSIHIPTYHSVGFAPIISLTQVFIASVVFSYAYEKYDNLFVPIAIHSCYNVMIVFSAVIH